MTVNAADRAPPVGQRCPLEGAKDCGYKLACASLDSPKRLRLWRSRGLQGTGRAAGPAQGWAYFFQKRAVNNTSTDSSSSRPSNIAKVSTQIWTSVKTP